MLTPAFIFFLHDVKLKSDVVKEVLSREYEIYTSLRTIEEVSYVLIQVRATKLFDVKGIHGVKEVVKYPGLDFVKEELERLQGVIKDYDIRVLYDRATIEELHEVMKRYRLLPGVALIALTCKHYGIVRILTFDEDFRKVPWLRVIP